MGEIPSVPATAGLHRRLRVAEKEALAHRRRPAPVHGQSAVLQGRARFDAAEGGGVMVAAAVIGAEGEASQNAGVVIASEAKQSRLRCGFSIASSLSLLAMTAVLRR